MNINTTKSSFFQTVQFKGGINRPALNECLKYQGQLFALLKKNGGVFNKQANTLLAKADEFSSQIRA